ncbi:FGGY-family carbohydrate kinase [Micromonospora sp. DT81.3]|uniref:FGGY-family carbohydrate kinase n=1 Tax=Micromonospora sp. DT81.3 TaxID=3416523 RepID=UPI003CEE3CC9
MRNSQRTPVACGVDIGSTNVKVVALTAEGTVVARASCPTPRDADGLSIDAMALLGTIEEMVREVCGDRFEVHAVSAAGVGEDGVLVDDRLRPLTKALAWFDPRRQQIFRALRPRLHDDDTFDVDSDPVRTLVGWEWSRRQATAGAAHSWVALTDLAGVYWTGRTFISDTLASRTAAWRSSDRQWVQERVELTLGSVELLPPVVSAGETVGHVDSPSLRSAGVIATDAIAVAGGHDHPIGGWGVEQIEHGAVLDSMGTAEVVVAQSARPSTGRPAYVDVSPGIRSSGLTLLRVEELARNVTWAAQDPAVARHIAGLLDGTIAPEPVLNSGYFVPGRRGGGIPRYASDAPVDPRALASAVLGALAVAGRQAVDAVSERAGGRSGVWLAGGWVRSPGWLAIKSAVNGYAPAPILEPEVTAVGAALLAAQARGWEPDPAQALSGSAVGVMR